MDRKSEWEQQQNTNLQNSSLGLISFLLSFFVNQRFSNIVNAFLAGSLCDMLSRLLEAAGALDDVPGDAFSRSDKQGGCKITFQVALVSCCDLSKLRQTGKLVPRRSFLWIPNLHAIVAPLLVRLGWARSKVRNIYETDFTWCRRVSNLNVRH